jgi:hypothetical protein
LFVKVQDNGSGDLCNPTTLVVNLHYIKLLHIITIIFSIAGIPTGTIVGTAIATNPEAGQTLTLSITAGNTNGAFTIITSTGAITVVSFSALI